MPPTVRGSVHTRACRFWLGSHRKAIEVVQRYGHWIVPGVFMLIGAVIIVESGVLARLT